MPEVFSVPAPVYLLVRLCGKDHVTADKRCKSLFRTLYIVKKRQWERKLEEEARKQEERFKADAGNQPRSRKDCFKIVR